jgi:hypothetical protein
MASQCKGSSVEWLHILVIGLSQHDKEVSFTQTILRISSSIWEENNELVNMMIKSFRIINKDEIVSTEVKSIELQTEQTSPSRDESKYQKPFIYTTVRVTLWLVNYTLFVLRYF